MKPVSVQAPLAGDLRILWIDAPGETPSSTSAERLGMLTELLEAGHPVARRASDRATSATSGAHAGGEFPRVLARLAHGASADSEGGGYIDLDRMSAGDVSSRVADLRESRELVEPGSWTPWFPVIDHQRCTNCMQCLSFCLFDVYGTDAAGTIEVRNEDNCKTNCPACSRVCPEVAILFPKYAKGPINGDVVREADIAKESMKVDISALLGGDIYSELRKRSEGARERFSTERDESKALLERKRCLKALRKDLDIPDEVLMSLPSAGEIEERAERARAKAERRRAASQSIKDQGAGPPITTEKEWDI